MGGSTLNFHSENWCGAAILRYFLIGPQRAHFCHCLAACDSRFWTGLASKGEGGDAADAETVDDEDLSGVGFVAVGLDAGGHEEAVQLGSAEGAGGGLDGGQVDLLKRFAGNRVEAHDAAAVAESDPYPILGVDHHTVGRAVEAGGPCVDSGAFAGEVAAGEVEIVGPDFFGGRIDVIHRIGRLIPADAVGVRHARHFE